MTPITEDEGQDNQSAARAPAPSGEVAAILRRHSLMAAGAGLVPLPVFDFVATSAIALRMLRHLAAHYDIEFFTEAARSAISALAGGSAATLVAFGPIRGATATIPGVGVVAALALGSTSAAAVVYALGRVFSLHFSLGGSFLDFDPKHFEAYFAEQVKARRQRS